MSVFFRELTVWQKSIDLVEAIYVATQKFPPYEQYGLVNQVRRAAIAIPSNIAEGAERESTKDFLRFLSIARGSQGEVETQLVIARRLKYIQENELNILLQQVHEIGRMINGLQQSLNKKLEYA